MAEQNFKNHTRIDPRFHLVLVPILLANLIITLVRLFLHPTAWHGWSFVVAAALLWLAFLARVYALQVQDRVIRLEERLRLAALLPLQSQALQGELTTRQLIALRFASDAEAGTLAERAARERLAPKAIKQAIRDWRADTNRV